MKKCKRNVFLIFGYMLLMAVLFVPYYTKGPYPTKGFKFLLLFISGGQGYIDYNKLATECSVIIFAAGFAYILFCVVLRKEKEEK